MSRRLIVLLVLVVVAVKVWHWWTKDQPRQAGGMYDMDFAFVRPTDPTRDVHVHNYQWLEVDWGVYAWVCECGDVDRHEQGAGGHR